MTNKRTWSECENPEIMEIFRMITKEAENLYPFAFEGCKPELFIDNSKSHLGMCQLEFAKRYTSKRELQMDANANKVRYTRGVILISKYIIHDTEKVKDVMCHELGHYVTPSEHHGYLWRIRANNIGKKWGVTNERLDKSGVLKEGMEIAGVKREENKYTIACPKCGAEWKYKRMCIAVENPGKYQCAKCKEKLIRTR